MLSIQDALDLVLAEAAPLPATNVELPRALGHVLAEFIVSDIDSPPHDKSIVDGYAIQSTDASAPGAELQILEEVTAGEIPTQPVVPGTATRIMTGAPIPTGADAVVMVEQADSHGQRVRIRQAPVKPGQNIMRRATSLQRGQQVLSGGRLLRPIEIGLLAEVGRSTVQVITRPTVAVLATGNELVNCDQVPNQGQIRNSNGPMLAALASSSGASVQFQGIARDDAYDLERAIVAELAADVLVVSGGVSAGVLDLVPAALERLGVRQVFHKVNLKPGKPLWFGVRKGETGRNTLVFGLPGNPVSSLACFELFVLPAIQKLRGLTPTGLPKRQANLASKHEQRGDRPTYWPAKFDPQSSQVMPLPWQGSGDLHSLTGANCLAFFPPGNQLYLPGQTIDVILLDEI